MNELERKYRLWDKVNRCYIEDIAEIKPFNSNNIVKEYYVCMDMLKKHELYVGDAIKVECDFGRDMNAVIGWDSKKSEPILIFFVLIGYIAEDEEDRIDEVDVYYPYFYIIGNIHFNKKQKTIKHITEDEIIV